MERPEPQDEGTPCIPIWDAAPTVNHPPSPEDFQHLITHLPDPRGGNILYQFRVRDFALTWHDTTGKIREDAPEVVDLLRELPPTDVHMGAVLAFGMVTNCLRSLRTYIEALKPKIYAATHHDNFTWFLGASAEDLEPVVRAELDKLAENIRPEILYSYDPEDYLNYKLYTFDPASPEWR